VIVMKYSSQLGRAIVSQRRMVNPFTVCT
jgi:hypothetical protein